MQEMHALTATAPLQVLPTGSAMSVSIWDAPSAEVLLAWLNENLQYDAVHDVHEVCVWGGLHNWVCVCVPDMRL
jgi:hypothetical protein